MTPTRKSLLIVSAFVVIAFAQKVASADPLVLSLPNNSLTGVAGGSVTFVASAFNSDATNTNTVTIGILNLVPACGCLSADFSPTIANWNDQVVANLTTHGPLPLVTLFIPAGTPDGTIFSGILFLDYFPTAPNGPLGGIPPGLIDTNQVEWTITVGSGPAPVPEPTTMVLLSMGLVGVAAKVKRRRSQ